MQSAPDGTELWQVSKLRPRGMMFLGGWSPDGKQVLYTETINFDFMNASPVIATLDPKGRARVIRRKPIQIPRMTFDFASLSADGQSILFIGQKAGIWNIYRFGLINKKLVRLTKNLTEDVSAEDAFPHEWNPRLPVTPHELTPTRWGRDKDDPVEVLLCVLLYSWLAFGSSQAPFGEKLCFILGGMEMMPRFM